MTRRWLILHSDGASIIEVTGKVARLPFSIDPSSIALGSAKILFMISLPKGFVPEIHGPEGEIKTDLPYGE